MVSPFPLFRFVRANTWSCVEIVTNCRSDCSWHRWRLRQRRLCPRMWWWRWQWPRCRWAWRCTSEDGPQTLHQAHNPAAIWPPMCLSAAETDCACGAVPTTFVASWRFLNCTCSTLSRQIQIPHIPLAYDDLQNIKCYQKLTEGLHLPT